MLSITTPPPSPVLPGNFNLAAHVLAAGLKKPDATALEILHADHIESWTYQRLISAILGCGTGLLKLGLTPGDRILMRLGNTVDFPILVLGAIAAGLVPVPTSAQLTSPEVARLCTLVTPSLIVAAPGIALPDAPPCPILPAKDLHQMAAFPPVAFATGDANRLAYIIFTSGTSGMPQAVAHAHRAILARQMMMDGWYGLTPSDRLLHAGAFNWTYTLGTGLLDPWTLGACALIPATAPTDLAAHLARSQATIFAAAPGVYRQMLHSPLPPLPHLRHGLSAGEALQPALRQNWYDQTGTAIHEALGMSEISTFVSGSPARPAPFGTSGYPQPGRHIAVLDEAGSPVPRGASGTLAVSRSDPGLFLGYFNDPATTEMRFSGEWYLTGDTVQMTRDGAIRYLGRNDDMMNAGGYRVSPLEVEEAMLGFPGLQDCAVVEHEVKPGTTVIACLYTSPAPVDPQDLKDHAATRLARYKQPRIYCRIEAIAHTANGKVNRRDLRQWLAKNPANPTELRD